MKTCIVGLIAVLLAALGISNRSFAEEYRIVTIGTGVGEWGGTGRAYDINDSGQVVGVREDGSTAFIWSLTAGLQELGVGGYGHPQANHAIAINNLGQVAGANPPFYWSTNTGRIELEPRGSIFSVDINDAGTVVVGPDRMASYKWTLSGGIVSPIGDHPTAINNNGWIVSLAGVIDTPDSHPFSSMPGGSAEGMNDAGEVVGYFTGFGEFVSYRAFVWSEELGKRELGFLPGLADRGHNAVSINIHGQAVGYGLDVIHIEEDVIVRAAIWGTNLVAQALPSLGGIKSKALAINNNGWIVGYTSTALAPNTPIACVWIPKTPADKIGDLINLVIDLNLQVGIENSLDAKLESAISALEDANTSNNQAAIQSLEAFINAVEAQRGNKISNEDADALIAAAVLIINSLTA